MRNNPDSDSAQVPRSPSTLLTVHQDPVSSSLPSCFELVPTACIQMCCLQPTFQQLSKPGETLRRDPAHSSSTVAWVRLLCAVACFAMDSQQHQGTPLNLLPTLAPGWAPGAIRICVGIRQGMVQINNCNLLCTAWMADTSKTWTTKLKGITMYFLKLSTATLYWISPADFT